MISISDAVLLNTRRVGHGLGFAKHPSLYKYLIKKQIAIEVCPASNQILGYHADLRNHPGLNYYKSGVPIVLSGDDPGSFGYNDLTVDYYLTYMAWGLDLFDLREIANNSIRYSIVPETRRQEGFVKFDLEWNRFVDQTFANICSTDRLNRDQQQMNVSDVLPSYGPNNEPVKVTLYGFGFEAILCKTVHCLFGEAVSEGELVNLDKIRCTAPLGFEAGHTVNLSIRVDADVYSTEFAYTFVSPASIRLVNDQIEDLPGMLLILSSATQTFIQSIKKSFDTIGLLILLVCLGCFLTLSLFCCLPISVLKYFAKKKKACQNEYRLFY